MTAPTVEGDLSNAHETEYAKKKESPLPFALVGLTVLALAAVAMMTLPSSQYAGSAVAVRDSTGRAHLATALSTTEAAATPRQITLPLPSTGRAHLATDRRWVGVGGGAARHGHAYALKPLPVLGSGR